MLNFLWSHNPYTIYVRSITLVNQVSAKIETAKAVKMAHTYCSVENVSNL